MTNKEEMVTITQKEYNKLLEEWGRRIKENRYYES